MPKSYLVLRALSSSNPLTYRAACKLVFLAVVRLVVICFTITYHSHDIREDRTRTIVLVRVEEDPQTFELVFESEHRPFCSSLFREPHGETIAIEIPISCDFELEFNLRLVSGRSVMSCYICTVRTSQFVAVSGTRENIHPARDCRSAVNLIYLYGDQSSCL